MRPRSIIAVAALALSICAGGCATTRPAFPPQSTDDHIQALPFKGRLVNGNRSELPADVAASLATDSPITFTYREELTHQEHRVPLIISALDPATYAGASLGDHSVTAFASLAIFDGDWILGDYTAQASVSESYDLYSEPSHLVLEHAARAAVRAKIDGQLSRDAGRLARLTAAGAPPPAP